MCLYFDEFLVFRNHIICVCVMYLYFDVFLVLSNHNMRVVCVYVYPRTHQNIQISRISIGTRVSIYTLCAHSMYGVATTSRLLKIVGLFCKSDL